MPNKSKAPPQGSLELAGAPGVGVEVHCEADVPVDVVVFLLLGPTCLSPPQPAVHEAARKSGPWTSKIEWFGSSWGLRVVLQSVPRVSRSDLAYISVVNVWWFPSDWW